MKAYLNILGNTVGAGVIKGDRTGTGTIATHAQHFRHDMSKGFPLLTTKKVSFKNILTEWKWMFMGMTDVRYLQDNNCTIWDEWATVSQCNKFKRVVGDLGPVYGHQWRNFGATQAPMQHRFWDTWRETLLKDFPIQEMGYNELANPFDLRDSIFKKTIDDLCSYYSSTSAKAFLSKNTQDGKYYYGYEENGFDQVVDVLKQLKTNPDSRRIIVSGWNPKEATQVALPPCHTLWQLQVLSGKLNLCLHQRSLDEFLGFPYNIAFYGLTIEFFSMIYDLTPGELVINAVDAHVYLNQLEVSHTQLKRIPTELPKLKFSEEYVTRVREVLHRSLDSGDNDLDIGKAFTRIVDELEYGKNVELLNYNPQGILKADVAV